MKKVVDKLNSWLISSSTLLGHSLDIPISPGTLCAKMCVFPYLK